MNRIAQSLVASIVGALAVALTSHSITAPVASIKAGAVTVANDELPSSGEAAADLNTAATASNVVAVSYVWYFGDGKPEPVVDRLRSEGYSIRERTDQWDAETFGVDSRPAFIAFDAKDRPLWRIDDAGQLEAMLKPASQLQVAQVQLPRARTEDQLRTNEMIQRLAPQLRAEAAQQAALNRTLYPQSLAEQMAAACSNVSGIARPLDPALCRAAQDYANLLARTHQQGHFADGDPEYRAKRAGFTGSLRQPGKRLANGETSYGLGEVLAFGHPNIGAAFQGWMDSPGHRSALMESTFDVCGFGRNGTIYVGLFGNSQVSAAAPPASQIPRRQISQQPYLILPQSSATATPGYVNQPSRPAVTYRPQNPLMPVPNPLMPPQLRSCGQNGCGPARRGIFGRR